MIRFATKQRMLGVLPFVEDPDLSGSAAPALPQHLPLCYHHLHYLSFVSALTIFRFAHEPVLSQGSIQVLPLLAEIRLNDVNILITVLGEKFSVRIMSVRGNIISVILVRLSQSPEI